MYPTAPFIRNKRVAIDEYNKNTLENSQPQNEKYFKPILVEFKPEKKFNHILNCNHNHVKFPTVQLTNEHVESDKTIGFIDSQIKYSSANK